MGFPQWCSGKDPPATQQTQETWVWSLGWEDPLEEDLATHSSILAWKIPWTEEPSRGAHVTLWSMRLQKVRHDWSNWAQMHKLSINSSSLWVVSYINWNYLKTRPQNFFSSKSFSTSLKKNLSISTLLTEYLLSTRCCLGALLWQKTWYSSQLTAHKWKRRNKPALWVNILI